jgi:integrase
LKKGELVRLSDAIAEKKGPSAARHAMASLTRILRWWSKRDDDFTNPLAISGTFEFAKEVRDRILIDAEIIKIWNATKELKPYHKLVRFLLLTGCRRGEAVGATWKEFSGNEWLLPSSRNKLKVPLIRNLSKQAMDVLGDRGDDDDIIFGSRFADFVRIKGRFDRDCGVKGWTLHDLRRTARSLMSRVVVGPDGSTIYDAQRMDYDAATQKLIDNGRRIDAMVREYSIGHVPPGMLKPTFRTLPARNHVV